MRTLRGPNAPDVSQRVKLDGREFVLRWRWIGRASRWALDVSSADGVLLAGGIRVVPNVPLLDGLRGGRPELPPGDLILEDPRRSPQDPSLEDLASGPASIVYVEAADLAALAEAAGGSGAGGGVGGGVGDAGDGGLG